MRQRRKILFTTVWYPDRYDNMMGLFVRKHAAAVARDNDVSVVYTRPDVSVPLFSPLHLETNEYEGVHEYLLYYHASTLPVLRKAINLVFFLAAVFCLLRTAFRKEGRPDIIHVNVLTRWGVIAFLTKKILHIPYVITEHWTRYLSTPIEYRGVLRRFTTELVARHASKVMPVSSVLERAMRSCGIQARYEVVENVIDDFFFSVPAPVTNDRKTILHVSSFYDKAKNVSGILEAIRRLRKKREDFRLVLIGTGFDYQTIRARAEELRLMDLLDFKGEQTPLQVKEYMDRSDFFLLFSNYETAAIVLQETMACGKPWVSSRVGIAEEDEEHLNGVTVEPGDVDALTEKIDWMLDHHQDFPQEQLRSRARKYSYDAIARKFNNIYDETLRTN